MNATKPRRKSSRACAFAHRGALLDPDWQAATTLRVYIRSIHHLLCPSLCTSRPHTKTQTKSKRPIRIPQIRARIRAQTSSNPERVRVGGYAPFRANFSLARGPAANPKHGLKVVRPALPLRDHTTPPSCAVSLEGSTRTFGQFRAAGSARELLAVRD